MAKTLHIESVKELIEQIGRDRFTAELGHAPQVVSRAVTEDRMPAHWFVGVRDICKANGITVSEALFKWTRKSPTSTQFANNDAVCQATVSDLATIGGDNQ